MTSYDPEEILEQPEPGPADPGQHPDQDGRGRFGLSRRGALGAAGLGVAGLGAAFAGGMATSRATGPTAADVITPAAAYPFHGAHQAGIVTPAQDRLHFAAFDVTSRSRDDLVALLKAWTDAAARMTQGQGAGPLGPTSGSYQAPPDDTGEAIGLPPAGLTITFGFGPTLFRSGGKDRFGLAARQPAALQRLPHFPGDQLVAERSDGDLCIQACAEDPQVAVHAIRNLARIAFGTASIRWSQLGFGRTSSTTQGQSTPRNLFGFKDGTANLKAEETADVDGNVWVAAGDDPRADWLSGGSYLVARRINMRIEIWDRQSLGDQEAFVGRSKAEGAPLSGGTEFSAPDFTLKGTGDLPIIPTDSHVRLAHPDNFRGAKMLRRGYNFVDGSTGIGRLDAGLFFIAYVKDPRTHYIPIQNALARNDALQEYLQHTGSGVFAVPPGAAAGEFVGQALFD